MKSIAVGDRSFFQKYFSDPLAGILAGLFFLILKILPLSVARFLGETIGAFLGLIMWRRNHIALVNMQIAFPDKTMSEKKKILRKMWRHFGRLAGEIFHTNHVIKTLKHKGFEHIRKFYKEGKGGFLCSAHFGNWELPFGVLVAPNFKFNPVFRTGNNPYLNKILFGRREGIHIPKGPAGARLMLQVLKEGQFISILCDQKLREGMTVPFFEKPAQTATAMAGLALKLDLPIFMARCVWQKGGYYLAEILPPLKLPTNLPREQAEYEIMLRINQIYESWIREYPEQWLWIHRRFDKKIYE